MSTISVGMMEYLRMQIILLFIFGSVIAAGLTEIAKIKCSHVNELYYSDNHCRSFYRCTHRNVREAKQCAANAVFDFHKQTCTNQIAGGCQEPNCSGRADGIYADVTHGCHRSFMCHAERVHSVDNCPAQQLHDGAKCAPQETVVCNGNGGGSDGRGHQHQNAVAEAANGGAENAICRQQADGVHSDPTSTDCTTYVVCKNGRLMARKRCSKQAIFNGASCVPSVVYQCPVQRSAVVVGDVCQHRGDGLWPHPMQGCNSYVHCASGRQLKLKECASGQYFDDEERACRLTQQPAQLRRCIALGPSLDCEQVGDGFHVAENCETYYHCYRGYKTEYKCSTGRLYNGIACVPRAQYTCARSVDGDGFCHKRSDGYYRDPANDGCRTYHYCSNGYKITYLCEPGHIFDERIEQCVRQPASEYAYRCQLSNSCFGKSDGYHADLRTDCRNYFYCKNNEKLTQLTCRDNVFNGQECVSPQKYTCPSRHNHKQLNCMPMHCVQQQCQRHRNGFYFDLKSSCRDYFSCIEGKRSRLSCPAGKRFNGEICVAEDKFQCPIFCEKADTIGDCASGYMI